MRTGPLAATLSALLVLVMAPRPGNTSRALRTIGKARDATGAENKLCGPKALYTALALLGDLTREQEIIEKLNVSERGTSFGDLEKYAASRGYGTDLRRLTWAGLCGLDTTAVLWVDGSHFLAVDPRERNAEKPDSLRVYDVDAPSRWWPRDEIEAHWTGETLIVRGRPTLEKGALLVVNTALNDLGWIESDRNPVFVFHYRNTGEQPLHLAVAKVGCGCSTATLTQENVNPGESGQMHVSVNLSSKRGRFYSYVFVKTNDPVHPQWIATVACGVYQSSISPLRTLHVGHVLQGASVSKRFYVHDRGDKSLRVQDVQVTFDPERNGDIRSAVEVECCPAGAKHASDAQASFAVMPGDYLIAIRFDVSGRAACGLHTGKCVVTTNLPGERRLFAVDLRLNVKNDVIAKPEILILSPDEPSAEILLASASGRDFELAAPPRTTGDAKLNVAAANEAGDQSRRFRVSVEPDRDRMQQLDQGEVIFDLKDRESVVTRVLVYGARK